MILTDKIRHQYDIWKGDEKFKRTALDGVSLDVKQGEFVAILGANGSGKSTLAKHLNVLLLPDEGTVWIDGKDTRDEEYLWQIRTTVGMVFQNPDNQIIGTSVEEDVAFGPENRNLEPVIIQSKVTNSLAAVGLLSKEKFHRTDCRADKSRESPLQAFLLRIQNASSLMSLQQCSIPSQEKN